MAINWMKRKRERARLHYKRGKSVYEFQRNPYKTGVKVMLPVIIVLLIIIIVGFFAIKAGAAILVGKRQAKEVNMKKGFVKDLFARW